MKKIGILIFTVVLTIGLLAPAAMARGKGKSKHEPGPATAKEKPESRSEHGAAKHDDKRHEQGWERHDGFEVRVFGDGDARPPGWTRGKKTGWDNCGVPPGQAKKGECRTNLYRGRRYYYYRDDLGRIVVRRPIVQINLP
ncbi:MAG: hypothetical protein ACE14L_00870 [Terriglobales bacterium]